jgi:hypothetical protein
MMSDGVDILDRPVREVLEDERLLDRLHVAITLDTGCSYLDACGWILDSLQFMPSGGRGPLTVREAVSRFADADAVGADCGLLERRDETLALAREQELAKAGVLTLDKVREGGAPVDPDLDVAMALRDPVTRERRWQKARGLREHLARATPNGPQPMFETRPEWSVWDDAELTAGRDVLAAAEQHAKVASANAKVRETAMALDRVIASSRDRSSKVRELDREMVRLQRERDAIVPPRPVGRPEPTPGGVMTLERIEAAREPRIAARMAAGESRPVAACNAVIDEAQERGIDLGPDATRPSGTKVFGRVTG